MFGKKKQNRESDSLSFKSENYQMKDSYIFPAIFDIADDGVSVEFPDLPGCLPCGDTVEKLLKKGHPCLISSTARRISSSVSISSAILSHACMTVVWSFPPK